MVVSGSFIAAGVPNRNGKVGKVYLFDIATLAYVRAIENPLGVGDRFGSRLAFAGENLVVWAGGDALAIPQIPSTAYLINAATGDVITTLTKFGISDFTAGGLAASPNYIICGNAYYDGPLGEQYAGGYQVYSSTTGQHLWTTLCPAIPAENFRFGHRIAFIGNDLLVGNYLFGSRDNTVHRMLLVPPLAAVQDWVLFE